MTENVNDVVRFLRETELNEAELIDDPELNLMLDSYRLTYPLPYKCSRERCSTTLGYWALHSTGARIAPGPERRHRKGQIAGIYPAEPLYRPGRPERQETAIVGGVADLLFPELEFQHRFEESIEWAENGDGVITLDTNPTVGSGWPLRWRFTCPRCNSQYVHTNKEMLRLFFQTLYARRDEIRPGTIR